MQVSKITTYLQLMRFDKPIGILLLLWPTLAALLLAQNGLPEIKIILIFVAGTVVMRAAGCVINDFADSEFDSKVTRTKNRPLATNKITSKEALWLFIVVLTLAFILALQLNWQAIRISFVAALLTIIYPFMKRFTHVPQLILGLAFASGIPMAYAALNAEFNLSGLLLFVATVLWAVVYDTQYAMVDREDDLKIGLKSTAILFGKQDRVIIGILQIIILSLYFYIGIANIAIIIGGLIFIWQQWLIRGRLPAKCFQAFKSNHWFGFIIFLGCFY